MLINYSKQNKSQCKSLQIDFFSKWKRELFCIVNRFKRLANFFYHGNVFNSLWNSRSWMDKPQNIYNSSMMILGCKHGCHSHLIYKMLFDRFKRLGELFSQSVGSFKLEMNFNQIVQVIHWRCLYKPSNMKNDASQEVKLRTSKCSYVLKTSFSSSILTCMKNGKEKRVKSIGGKTIHVFRLMFMFKFWYPLFQDVQTRAFSLYKFKKRL